MAGLGVVFVLIAGLSATINSWDSMSAALRVAGLVALSVGATLIADKVRSSAQTAALAIALVGAGLAFPVGITTMSWLGQPWPVCLTVGALACVPVLEWQRRRWPALAIAGHDVRWFEVLQIGALAGGSFGAAAWTHVPAGVIAACVAAALVALRAPWRSVALSVIAVLAPLLGILAVNGVGAGTLARAGVVGHPLEWAGPLAGLIASVVVFIAGRRLRNAALPMMSPLLFVIGVATGLTQIDTGPAVWASIPALALALATATWHVMNAGTGADAATPAEAGLPALSEKSALIGRILSAVAAGLACALWWVGVNSMTGLDDLDASFLLTAVVWAVAFVLCLRFTHGWKADLIVAGLATTASLAAAALGSLFSDVAIADRVFVAAVALVVAVVAIWFIRQPAVTLMPVLTALAGVIAASVVAPWTTATAFIAFVLLGAWVALTIMALALHQSVFPGKNMIWPVTGIGVTAAYGSGLTLLATDIATEGRVGWFVFAMLIGVVGSAIAVSLIPETHPVLGWPVAIIGGLGLIVAQFAPGSVAVAVGFVAVALAAAVWNRAVHSQLSSVLAGGSVGAVVVTLAPALTTSVPIVQMVVLAALVATAVWVWFRGVNLAAASAALTIAIIAVLQPHLSPAGTAATWCITGIAGAAFAWRLKQMWATAGSLLVAGVSAVAWLWALGSLDWLIDALDTIGMTPANAVWVVTFLTLLGVAEVLMRTTTMASLWVYLIPFAVGTVTTVSVEWIRHPIWTVPFAVVVGVAAVVIGARRKVFGLLLGGVVISVATVITASRATLVLVPSWAWVGVGGVTLLAAAVTVERVAGGWSGVRRQAAYLAQTWR